MKELIDKLSLGKTEYTKPVVEVDIEEINIKMEAGKNYVGSFRVYSSNGKPLKGIIFSDDSRVVPENNRFFGVDCCINYTVNTEFVAEGEVIKGSLSIVTNGGEILLHYEITVDSQTADTTTGQIKNLFHFANLVQTSYDEAVKLFKMDSFAHIFLSDNLKLMAVYNGLIGSKDVNTAMEDFLIAANKKKAITLSISDKVRTYKDIQEDYGDTLVITKDSWGYVNIELEIEGDFIRVDDKKLTSLDFAGSNYELSYYIEKKKLYIGRNIGFIRLRTAHQTMELRIEVDNAVQVDFARREEKKAIALVTSDYLDFRMKRIDFNRWADRAEQAIARARSEKDSMVMKLMLAHVCISRGKESDGEWLLENVAEDLLPMRDEEVELYCYYLYIRTIQKRDDDFTEEMIKKIRAYYEGGRDSWQLLWILLYLDEMYDDNISLKLIRIKEQFMSGMNSPLMLYEALMCFNEVPQMLRVLDDFEIQVLYFGVKRNCIGEKLAEQFGDLLRTERQFNQLGYKIAEKLYEKFRSEELLQNLISLLIKCNKTDSKFFKWYELGVEKELKITSLYEYYMYAVDEDYEGMIPQKIMMYFAYNHMGLPDEKVDLLFANIIKNKEKVTPVYDAYKVIMEKYAVSNILEGRQSRNLAIVYEDVLNKAMIGAEASLVLPDIICTYEIICSESSMQKVIIVHKETSDIATYTLKKGSAMVRIFTEDVAVIFEDINGNRYENIQYELNKLMDMEDYLRLCYEISSTNKYLLLYFADQYLNYRRNPVKGINVLRYLLEMEGLVQEYKVQIEKEIIDFYSDNYDGDRLDDYLMSTSTDSLGAPARNKIIEMCIIRGLYDRAYSIMKRYGFRDVETRRILKCAAKIIESREYMFDYDLSLMSAFAFEKGKYNEVTLAYLGRYYDGTTKKLLEIWKAAKSFGCENREMEEKIIVQMLFSGEYQMDEVYDSYMKKGAATKVRKAYLFAKSYDYFVREELVEDAVFKHIDEELDSGNEVTDMSGIAYLKYMSEKKDLSDRQIEICKKLIYDLVRVGKKFEFFHLYKKYFELPRDMADKTIVEYRTDPENRVFIHYIDVDSDDKNEYEVAEMTPVCDGIFTYSFVLFYGEKIPYYITEESGDEVSVNESMNLSITQVDFAGDSTHYGLINDMLVCRDMKEEKTVGNMMKEYLLKKELMDSIFEIKK